MKKKQIIIIGAGPAGLATAFELIQSSKDEKYKITIIEKDSQVGGLSKTLSYKGYKFDLGGHRFYTKIPEIQHFFDDFLGNDMLKRERLSRIYYQKKYYQYPLSAANAIKNLGIYPSVKIFLSWFSRQMHIYKDETTFEKWVSNRFGDELFNIFFKSYTEKVWGIPTSALSKDWAEQRIQNFSLLKAIIHAFFRVNTGAKTIIAEFYYPKYGPGMLYERLAKYLKKKGVTILFDSEVTGFTFKNKRTISGVIVKTKQDFGRYPVLEADAVVSTMPFNKIVLYLHPPRSLEKAVQTLRFRNFITVNLIAQSNPFPDQWIYIHDPSVKAGRVQNFKNWSPYLVKHAGTTGIGVEYFCNKNEYLWNLSDNELLELAKTELETIELVKKKDILDGFVSRVEDAYPIYNFDYQTPYAAAKQYVKTFKNLYLSGRGGLFRYNNQDHSILSGFYTARNIIAGKNIHDVWSMSEDISYLETK